MNSSAQGADPLDLLDPLDLASPLDLGVFRQNGHALVDWIADYLGTLEQRPVSEELQPGQVRGMLPEAAPEKPEAFESVLADLDRVIAPGLVHWQHPGWFAYFPAMSSPASILGELAAAGFGVQGMLWSASPALTELEGRVVDWLVDLMGLPESWKTTSTGGGTLTSGASASTHIAMVTARERCRARTGASVEDMAVYASSQAHSSVEKGARLAGIANIRPIDVDRDLALDAAALEAAVERDRGTGLVPAAVTSAVGTTGTAAVDPLRPVGRIASRHDMWHHVDAAYAGAAMICEEHRGCLDGIELVDSYTFNPHKWLATNLDCSVLWVADRRPLIDAMRIDPPYLRNGASESGRVIDYRNWGVSLGRPFRALKLWFVLRSFGAEHLRAMIRRHCRWAAELSGRVDAHRCLRRVAPTRFGLVSFAHVDGEAATRSLAAAVNGSGRFHITVSEVAARTYLRICVGAIWTRWHHIEALWKTIEDHCEHSQAAVGAISEYAISEDSEHHRNPRTEAVHGHDNHQ